ALNAGMAALDEGLAGLDGVVAGKGTLPDAMEGPLGGLAQRLDDLLAAAADELDIERSQRLALEARLGKVGHLLDGFEQRAARYDALAAESRDDAGMTGEALATSGVRLR